MLVRLRPGLSRVWRGPQTVQIGLTPGRAAVLDGLTPDDARLIEQLNLGLDVRELDAGHVPPGPARGREILGLLAEAGVLLTTRTGRAALARLGTARERLAPDAAAWALSDPTMEMPGSWSKPGPGAGCMWWAPAGRPTPWRRVWPRPASTSAPSRRAR